MTLALEGRSLSLVGLLNLNLNDRGFVITSRSEIVRQVKTEVDDA